MRKQTQSIQINFYLPDTLSEKKILKTLKRRGLEKQYITGKRKILV